RWPSGRSVFGFESPYWDLGQLPILIAVLAAAVALRGESGTRRRFLAGFVACGIVAAIAYTPCWLRTARLSLVSVVFPSQTGLMVSPAIGKSLTSLKPSEIVVDTLILVSLPLLIATLGGVVASARITLRWLAIAIALVGLMFGAVTNTI